MPELPEVHTTATILHRLVRGKTIVDVWSDYNSPYYTGKGNIKDPKFFKIFKDKVVGKRILSVYRRAKNVLLDLDGDSTILAHMKMTGHFLYGDYIYNRKENSWKPKDPKSALAGPLSRFVHLVFTLDDGKFLAFSDMRKFATVTLLKDKEALDQVFNTMGPEPLDKNFSLNMFKETIQRKPNGKIKTVLMDHTVIAGIGNIYSDEILWASEIHPEKLVKKISKDEFRKMYFAMKILLAKGIDFGGDSMSDYRNPYGEKGAFQLHHEAYRRTGEKCRKKGCSGTITRKVVNGRSAHFCNMHQIKRRS